MKVEFMIELKAILDNPAYQSLAFIRSHCPGPCSHTLTIQRFSKRHRKNCSRMRHLRAFDVELHCSRKDNIGTVISHIVVQGISKSYEIAGRTVCLAFNQNVLIPIQRRGRALPNMRRHACSFYFIKCTALIQKTAIF